MEQIWDLPGHFLQVIGGHRSGALPQTPWGGRSWGGHHHQDDGELTVQDLHTHPCFGKEVPNAYILKSINRIQWSSSFWDEEPERGDSGEERRTETRSSKHEVFPGSQNWVWSLLPAQLTSGIFHKEGTVDWKHQVRNSGWKSHYYPREHSSGNRWRCQIFFFVFVFLFLSLFVLLSDRVSPCNPGCPGPHYIDQTGSELTEIHQPLAEC